MKNTTYSRQAGTREHIPELRNIDAQDMRNEILLMRQMSRMRKHERDAERSRAMIGAALIGIFVGGPVLAVIIHNLIF
jgi:hypothetical protein